MRPEGWEDRLAAEMTAALAREAEWGVQDCVTFAHRCAAAVLDGPTPWDRWMTGWTDARGAAEALRACGGLLAGLDSGAERTPLFYASRGDVAVVMVDGRGQPVRSGGRPAAGVVDGASIVMAGKPRGLARLPLLAAVAAWPVGR